MARPRPLLQVGRNQHDVVDLYMAANRTLPLFAFFLRDLRARCGGLHGSGVVPLKPLYRTLEKAAMRADGGQWSCSSVLDVVRGALVVFEQHMEDFARCLREVGE